MKNLLCILLTTLFSHALFAAECTEIKANKIVTVPCTVENVVHAGQPKHAQPQTAQPQAVQPLLIPQLAQPQNVQGQAAQSPSTQSQPAPTTAPSKPVNNVSSFKSLARRNAQNAKSNAGQTQSKQ
jgi:hypothetical protein